MDVCVDSVLRFDCSKTARLGFGFLWFGGRIHPSVKVTQRLSRTIISCGKKWIFIPISLN